MNDRHTRAALLAALLAALFVVGWAGEAAAQAPAIQTTPDLRDTRYVGLGYAPHLPKVFPGVSLFQTFPSIGFGYFVTGRYNLDSPEDEPNFEEGITPSQAVGFQDFDVQTREIYQSIVAGAIRPVTPNMALFLGAGYTRARRFIEFEDLSGTRGNFGYYWIEDTERERTGVNYTGGALIQMGQNVFFMGGAETFPKGFSMAVFLAMPW